MERREMEIRAMLRRALESHAPQLAGYRVFLFGSRATGHAGPRSDYDVGVIGPQPLPSRAYSDIEDTLDALPTLHRIDWVDFNQVSERFRERAMQQVEVLYE